MARSATTGPSLEGIAVKRAGFSGVDEAHTLLLRKTQGDVNHKLAGGRKYCAPSLVRCPRCAARTIDLRNLGDQPIHHVVAVGGIDRNRNQWDQVCHDTSLLKRGPTSLASKAPINGRHSSI